MTNSPLSGAKGKKMSNEPTIRLKDVLFLPGHTPAEGLVKTYYLSDDGKRIELTISLLEAMLLLRQLEAIRAQAGIEFSKDR
jgi:hypothetical protein